MTIAPAPNLTPTAVENLPVALGIVAGILTLVLTFRLFFGTGDRFFECLKYSFTPDFISWWRGDYHRDWVSSAVLWFWLLAGGLVGVGVGVGVQALIG